MKRLEPLWWLLFGAGGFVGAVLLPALYFMVAVGFPLGWFGDPVETFLRMRTLFANPVGQLVLVVGIALPFWHSAHHLRHFVIELGFPHSDRLVGSLLYALAGVGTLVTVGVVGAL
ncbi:MAG: fumarate reductase subunit D [Deltaproteobacteria bacterium]|nr:fumarate reductase subunit D [Deltaproteobacteria bacterium]MBW2415372.1 fumarate reductase subunit D [Deltaproteobacteria bacterium]